MLSVRILGSGCENCKKLAYLSERAAAHLGIAAQIEKVTDFAEIMEYHILSTPGLVINGKLVSAGRVPSEAEISTWIADAEMEKTS